ncbi:MAG: DUF3047 domain-containing protein [Proteobacteria bacterium]|nr:DUF3047 domain-containing protein [Pseudomonadota bacterium]
MINNILLSTLISVFLITAGEKILITNYEEGFKSWKIREFKGHANYNIKLSPKKMITLISDNNSFGLAKEIKLDLQKTPYLYFEWLVEKIPNNGDLRHKELDDQAAQLYVILPSFPEAINYKAIGYVWDSNAPPGVYQSKKFKNIRYVVLRTGDHEINKWVHEKVNVYEDFKRIWNINFSSPQKIIISINIDSDDTKSSAKSSFGSIYFTSE